MPAPRCGGQDACPTLHSIMTDNLFSVEDQVTIISGASRGIGRGLAEGFAQRGADVIITGRQEATLTRAAEEISTEDNAVQPIVCDVANSQAIKDLVAQVISERGRIDTLINCAGVNRRMRSEELTEDDYDFVVNINMKGAFLLSMEVGRHMIAQGKGSQINIASLNNDRPVLGVLPYAMSKAGMGHMTKALAMEWGPKGVRVNALAPGFIWTDLTQKLWSEPHMQEWNQANCPMQSIVQLEHMVWTGIFLALEASAFMTGQILYVDGGVTAGLPWPIKFDQQ